MELMNLKQGKEFVVGLNNNSNLIKQFYLMGEEK